MSCRNLRTSCSNGHQRRVHLEKWRGGPWICHCWCLLPPQWLFLLSEDLRCHSSPRRICHFSTSRSTQVQSLQSLLQLRDWLRIKQEILTLLNLLGTGLVSLDNLSSWVIHRLNLLYLLVQLWIWIPFSHYQLIMTWGSWSSWSVLNHHIHVLVSYESLSIFLFLKVSCSWFLQYRSVIGFVDLVNICLFFSKHVLSVRIVNWFFCLEQPWYFTVSIRFSLIPKSSVLVEIESSEVNGVEEVENSNPTNQVGEDHKPCHCPIVPHILNAASRIGSWVSCGICSCCLSKSLEE